MNNVEKAILVLTNGIASANEVSESTRLRLLKICDIDIDNTLIIASTGYTVNKKPFLDLNGFPVFESVIAANTLIDDLGIPGKQIITESFSRDTIGNVYLTFTSILKPMQIKTLTVVSSEFHLKRVEVICNWIGSIFYPELKIELIAAQNPIYEKDLNEAIIAKETESIKSLYSTIKIINTPQDFVFWFFHEHKAYSHLVFPEPINNFLQKAY